MSNLVPDEISMEDPLCNSSFGSMVTLDYVNPVTAERAVRRVKDGTSAVLLQSGLNESWWADFMECYTYLRNVTDLLTDGKTPYERLFGQLKPFCPKKPFEFCFCLCTVIELIVCRRVVSEQSL